jgi:hypothetical protein
MPSRTIAAMSVAAGPPPPSTKQVADRGTRKNGRTVLAPKRSTSAPQTSAKVTVVSAITDSDLAKNASGQPLSTVM